MNVQKSLWGLLAAIVFVLLGQICFYFHTPYSHPISLKFDPMLIISMPLFFGGLVAIGWLWQPKLTSFRSLHVSTSCSHKLIVCVLCLVAFGVRIYMVTEMPPPMHDDEGNIALSSLEYREHGKSNLAGFYWYQTPGAFVALNSLGLELIGNNVLGARSLGILLGSLTALVVYFAGRALMSPGFGVLAMLAFALQRWHMGMSRWAGYQTVLTFFAALAFLFAIWTYALKVGQRKECDDNTSRSDYKKSESSLRSLVKSLFFDSSSPYRVNVLTAVLSGLALGACMYVYLVSRLVALGMACFLVGALAYAVLLSFKCRRILWELIIQRTIQGLLVGGVFLVVFWPLASQYITNSELFVARWREVSIFTKLGSEDLSFSNWSNLNFSPLIDNFIAYLLMFNYASNEISRHGIPLRPLLNPISGTLFAIGFVLLLRHFYRPANLLILLWLILPVFGGFLTHQETPCTFRAIASSSAVALITIVPFFYLHSAISGSGVGRSSRATLKVMGLGAILMMASGLWDLRDYWVLNASSSRLYSDFHYRPYTVARRATEISDQAIIVVSPSLMFSSFRLLNYGRTNIVALSPNDHVPFITDSNRDVHFLIDDEMTIELRPILMKYYPTASVVEHRSKGVSESFWEIAIPKESIAATRGVAVIRQNQKIHTVQTFVVPNDLSEHDSIEFITTLDVPTDPLRPGQANEYHFRARSNNAESERVRISINGILNVDENSPINLLAGGTELRVSVAHSRGGEAIPIEWRKGSGEWREIPSSRMYDFYSIARRGMRAKYFTSIEPNDTPVAERVDLFPTVASETFIKSPHSTVWSGLFEAVESGEYGFLASADDGMQLTIDGQTICDAWSLDRPRTFGGTITLTKGFHPIQIKYFDLGGGRGLGITWDGPSARGQLLSPRFLSSQLKNEMNHKN